MNPQGKPEGLRQAMAWFHTWAGLLLGWLMFAIFLTGSLTFFRHEITQWMKPELQAVQAVGEAGAGTLVVVDRAMRRLAPDAASWFVSLPDGRQPTVRVFWQQPAVDGKRGGFESGTLDPSTGEVVAERKTFGGDFFYRFHFELRSAEKSRWILEGRWVVGVATMAMFVALLSGIVTHRRIFADFFTFRPGKGGQRAWLDAHNVSGVLVLPFYLLITFSGLMMFHTLYLPAGIAAAYGPQKNEYFSELQGSPLPPLAGTAPRTPMPPLPWAEVLAQAGRQWPGGHVEGFTVQRGGEQVRLELRRGDDQRLQYPGGSLVFDGRSGELLAPVDNARPAAVTYGVLYGLHMARFAGIGLRLTLLGLGLLGTAMIATGLVLWSVKRRAQLARSTQAPHVGLRLVESLNIASIAGLPLAVGAYLASNRLLPVDWPDRSDAELKAFFGAWGLVLLWSLVAPTRRTWQAVFALAAIVFLGLPALSAVTTPRHLGDFIASGDWVRAGVELGWLGAGLVFGIIAGFLRARPIAQSATRHSPSARSAASTNKPAASA